MPIGYLLQSAPYIDSFYFVSKHTIQNKTLNKLVWYDGNNNHTKNFLLRTKENQFLFEGKIVYLFPEIFNDPTYRWARTDEKNYLHYTKYFVDDWTKID